MTSSDGVLIEELGKSPNPSIRWKVLNNILGVPRSSADITAIEQEIRTSPTVEHLLQRIDGNGRFENYRGVYDKWQGSHWVVLTLADIGFPQKDQILKATFDELFSVWLAPRFHTKKNVKDAAEAYRNRTSIPVMENRIRTCASQQGNCLFSAIELGHVDDRVHELADLLMDWQWPDGGWNCDKNPAASTSTFVHTVWCMRALGLYGRVFDHHQAQVSAERAAEFLLSRKLFLSRRTERVVRDEFTKLHYPAYWHYDILIALKAFAQIDYPRDIRMMPALEEIQRRRLKTGGWAADSAYYKGPMSTYGLGHDYVNWGGTNRSTLNPWITVDALFVLDRYAKS